MHWGHSSNTEVWRMEKPRRRAPWWGSEGFSSKKEHDAPSESSFLSLLAATNAVSAPKMLFLLLTIQHTPHQNIARNFTNIPSLLELTCPLGRPSLLDPFYCSILEWTKKPFLTHLFWGHNQVLKGILLTKLKGPCGARNKSGPPAGRTHTQSIEVSLCVT